MKINGNQKAIGAATLGTAVLVEEVIGGIGISMLGTAIGIPAAAIVVAGGAIALACGLGSDDKSDTPKTPSTPLTSYLLVKSGVTHKFSVNKDRGWGQTCLKTASSPDWTNYRYFSTLGELRDFYKSLLQKGYKPA